MLEILFLILFFGIPVLMAGLVVEESRKLVLLKMERNYYRKLLKGTE
jgi:hypothetical protein